MSQQGCGWPGVVHTSCPCGSSSGRDNLPAFPQSSAVVMKGRAGAVNTMRTKALCISYLSEDTLLRVRAHWPVF